MSSNRPQVAPTRTSANEDRDRLQRIGNYPVPPGASDLPGLEVRRRGRGLRDPAAQPLAGRRPVCALVHGGGYAEYCAGARAQCAAGARGPRASSKPPRCPRPFSPSGATSSTAAQLQPGETLLVQGGTSGIGVTAIQMATALGAPRVRHRRLRREVRGLRALGAERAINYHDAGFRRRVDARPPAARAST